MPYFYFQSTIVHHNLLDEILKSVILAFLRSETGFMLSSVMNYVRALNFIQFDGFLWKLCFPGTCLGIIYEPFFIIVFMEFLKK